MTHAQDPKTLEMFVIDVLRHGQGGQLESVLSRLNNRGCIGWREYWSHDFSADDVVPVLKNLAMRHIVEVAIIERNASTWSTVEPTDELFRKRLDELWFFMTDKAYEIWDKWEPPPEIPE